MTSSNTPNRPKAGYAAFLSIASAMEGGSSQVLTRKQALLIAAWALKIAGERELHHQILSELIEPTKNYG
jgi:hypothetical protein